MKSISLSRNVTIDTIQGSGRVLVNGELTTLSEGATLPSGTQLGLPDSSDTVITLSDGTQLMIEPQSESSDSLFDALPQDVQDEIADIQQQILDGEGEITIQEDQATAAGQDATGSGSWSYVNIARDGSETIASSGFDSDSIANNAGAIGTNQEDGFGRLVDTTAPNAPGVSILNDANNDGVISSQEIGDGIRVFIDLTGTNANPGDVLTVNGQAFTLTDDNITDGSVVVTLPDTPADGETLTVDATITDTSGNTSAPGSDSATIDTSADAGTVSVDNITSDDVINAQEAGEPITVTGTAIGGDISEGDVVTMTINGTEYSTIVDGSGNWTVDVAGADLAADTEFEVVVSSSDAAGNTVESIGSSEHTVDTVAPGEGGDNSNSIEFVDGNDLLSEDELKAVELTGKVETDGTLDSIVISGKDANGDDVSYTLQSGDYSLENGVVTVTNLDLSSEGFADGTLTVTMTVTDKAGNTGDVTDTIALDLTAPGEGGDNSNSIEFVDGNDLLSEDELKAVELTGKVETDGTLDSIVISGKDANGDDVSYTLQSGDYSLENGVVTVTNLDLSSEGFADGTLTVTMTVTDKAGNTGDVTDTIALDLTAPGEGGDNSNSIEFVDGNDLLSEDELKAVELTGKVETDGTLDSIVISGKDANGDDVSYTLQSGDYSLENGVVTVTNLDLSSEGFADGTLTVTMTVTDKAGNTGDVTDTIALDLTAPGEGGDNSNSIEFVDGNDLLSEDELKAVELTGKVETDGTLDSIVISGKDANGDDVSYTLQSGDYSLENGVVTVTNLDLSSEGFADGTLTVTMTVTDKAGNTGDVTDTIALDLTAPGEGGDNSNSIEFVDGNDLLSEDELKAVELTGKVETDGTLDSIVISGKDANGDDVSYTLQSGDYSLENGVVTVTNLDLSSEGFADGTLTVTMTVTDKAGNTGDVTDTIALDLTAPGEGGDNSNSIEFVDGNDLLSEDELKAVELTGKVETDGTLDSIVISGKDANGDDVSYTLQSGDYSLENGVVTVTNLDLSSEGFADGTLTVTMTVTDKAGNTGDVTDTIALDLTAPGEGGDNSNSIEFVDGNDLLSEDELKAVELTGKVETDGTLDSIVISGKDANGDDVSYTLQSGDYSLENGVVTVTNLDLSSEGFADGTLTVTMTVTDKAGNTGDVTDTIALDLTAPGEGGDNSNSIEFVDGNDLLSEDELKAVELTGKVETDGTLDSIVISGKDANGDDVSYTLQSGDYSLENGVVTVTNLDLSSEGFADGTLTVTMTVTDKAGNTGDVTDTIALDLTAPGEGGDNSNSIEFVDGNDLLSEDELKAVELTGKVETDGTLDSIVISGKDANGDDVSYTLQSGDYSLENGVVTVTNLDLSSEGFADGTLTVTMTVTDKAGNTGDVTDTIALDLTAPGEGGDNSNSIEFVDGNDLLSEDELKAVELTGKVETDGTLDSIVISGKDANGDDVSYTLQSGDYSLENGVVTVTNLDLSSEGFADGTLTVTMTVTDKAGNTGDVTDTIALDLTAPGEGGDNSNSIEFVDGNDLLSEDELKAVELTGKVETDGTLDSIVISGKDANGDDVSYTLQSGDYSLENGVVTVTNLDLSSEGFADGTLTVTMTVTDKAGNTGDVTDTIALDLTAPGEGGDNSNSIEFVDGNDLLSEDELKAVELTGKVETDGTLDSIVISGKDANGDDVSYTLQSGDYSLENGVVTVTNLDLSSEGFADGTLTVTMTVTDKAGNTGDVTDTIALDLTAPGEGGDNSNSIEFVDGNDLLSEDELKAVELTGKVETDGTLDSIVISGKDANGDDVSYTLQSGDYSLENGVVTVTNLDLSSEGFADGTLTVTMTVTDKAGNTGDVTDTIALDLTAPGEGGDNSNSIEFVDGNDLLSEDELKAVELTGKVETDGTLDSIVISGKDANGDDVSYTLQSGDYSLENGVVTVTNLDLSSEGFADGTLTVTMTVTDKAGNTGDVTDTIALDLTAPGEGGDNSNSIEFVDGNDLLSEDELKAVELTGKVETDGTLDSIVISGKDANGDDVSYTLQSGDYSLENGVVTVTNLDLSSEGFADGTLTVTMTVTDKAGNTGDVTDTIALDTNVSKPTIDLVATSDSGDSAEDNLTNDTTPTFALGNIDSDVVRVEVFLGSTSLGFAGKDSKDNWMFTPQKLLSAGAYNFTVQVTDSAGNSDISDGLQVTIDTSASATITIDTIADDDVVNEQEASGDVTVTGAVGGDAKPGDTVTLTLQAAGDDVTTYTGIVKDDGTYSINVPGSALASDADSAIVASVTGTDKAGNPFTATTSPSGENKDGDYEVDIDAPNPPVITNITDDSEGSDYSDVTMHGTGEPGAVISIYFEGESGTPLAQATVAADGSWAVELEGIDNIGTNDNVRLEAVQSDAAGNQSEPSEAVHYWHGSWANANTETGDDYVLTGEGNDTVNIITDDANDQLVIDGGAGTDKAVFNTRVDHLSFSKDSNGYLIVENSDTGDRIELRDFETINIDGDEKHIDELFTPTVTISEDANDDGVITANELNGDVDVIVGLPLGASVGDTIRVSDGTTTNEIVLVEADIDNGSVATSFDAPAEGETLTVTAELEDQIGNTSEPGSDSAVLDTQYGGEDGEDPSDIRLPNIVITDSTENDGDDVITNSETAEITVDFGEGVTAGTSTIVLRDSSGNDSDVELQLVWDHNGPRINVINGELDANALTLSGQNGLFTISGIDVSNLQDGNIDAFASFIDQDGNVATNVNGSQWFDDSVVKSFAPVITIGSGVNVSEEGLDGGNADSAPTGTDTTNSPSVSGEFAVTGGVGNVTVALAGGSGLTSNGEAVAWTWDASTNRLIGYTSTTNPVVSIALNEPTPGNEVWTYDVELHGSLDHSDSQTEDTLALPINVVVSDDNHTGLSKPLSVTVEDDSPETTAAEAIPVELQDIPDVLTGKVSFKGQGSGDSVTFGDVTVTALGFANDYNTQLEYDKVNLSSDGIGVDSGSSPTPWPWPSNPDEHGHPLSNEIEYRITETGQGVSEQLIFSLNGKVAYGAQIEFSKMYGGELESGIVRFYRDGQLIAEKAFTSDEASGDYAKNFDIQEGGFDQITIEATDNGNRNGPDNSDLTVKSITFTGASDQQAIAVADGTLQYHAGADGLGSLKITGVEDGLRTAEGLAITTRFDGNNRLIATDENGALVFEVQLTPATGKWEFYQYQVVQTPEGDADIDFSYQVVDGDGDSATGEFSVQPANVPEPQNYSIETGDGVDQIDMLQSVDSGWLALNVGLSGSEKVVINDESFTIDGPETHRMSEFVSDWRVTDNHVIDAGGGDDNVRGGEGDDVLIGGRGSDMLTGSDGADTFSWSMADVNSQNGHEYTDTISDFSAEDTLNLNDLFKGDSVNGEFSRFSVTVSDDSDNDGTVDVTLKFDYHNRADADQTIELSNVKMEGGTVVINTLIDGERGALTIDKHSDGSISVTSNHDALDDIRIDTDW